ncbi:hypothetical protein V6B16_13935 [Salinimicrobium catena]|uniref:hypothetical protein n=1 Tax=Salinimicrobium catena TaxID=390640 RepID=UPI002FE47D77
MKKILFSLLFILGISFAGVAQTYSYGLKGGINYSMGGVIRGEKNGANNDWDETLDGTGKMGFQFGAYGQVNFGKFFVRPEVVYNKIERQWDFPLQPSTHSVQKLDIPLLAGYNILGPLDVFAGPVYSSIMDSSLEGEQILDQVVVQNSPINAQIGLKAEFGRFGIDLRYEKSLSTPETQNLDIVENDYGANEAYYEDSAIDLVKVNVTFKIGGSDMKNRRRRGGNCY